jgi:hypothetical protein
MPIFATGSPRTPDLVVRLPTPGEFARVAHLFRNTRLRKGSRFIVAERTQPIPRFIAAAAWWTEGATGRFHLACQPGLAAADMTAGIIESILAASREAGLETVQYAELLPEGSPWLKVLQAQGFERARSERSFQVSYRDAWTRVMRLYEKHRAQIPSSWRTDPIRQHKPEVILDLVAPHRLLPPDELRHFWEASAAAGFDLDLSCVLFDQERPFGTFLARCMGDVIYIDVQVVQEPNPRLRSLADLCLLHHDASRVPADGPIRWIRFRSGQSEHRQTANLALRMGGRELTRMHVLEKRLTR